MAWNWVSHLWKQKLCLLGRGGGDTPMIMVMLPIMVCIFLFLSLSLPSSLCAGTTVGEDGLRGTLPVSNLHACAFNKLIFHNLKEKEKLSFATHHVRRKQSKSRFILTPISGFLFLLSCRGREWPRLRDLRESAALLPEYHLRHHWQLCHFRARGGFPGPGAAPPAQTEQSDDSAGASPAAPGAALPPGGPGPPPPLQCHLQRQQRHPVHGQPALPQPSGPGLAPILFRGRARPKVRTGADAGLTKTLLICAASPHLLLLLTEAQCCTSVACTGSNFRKSECFSI